MIQYYNHHRVHQSMDRNVRHMKLAVINKLYARDSATLHGNNNSTELFRPQVQHEWRSARCGPIVLRWIYPPRMNTCQHSQAWILPDKKAAGNILFLKCFLIQRIDMNTCQQPVACISPGRKGISNTL